jgi:hypothetical protein
VGAVGGGSLALINLPFILINASGWWTTYRFHVERPPASSGSIWVTLDHAVSTTSENRASFLALAAALVTITAVLAHTRSDNAYPVVEWCAAYTAAFIVLNKVSSPQYILWLVPFLALLSMRSVWWWLLSIIATVRYAALFGVDVFPLGQGTADRLVDTAVTLQAAVLVLYVAAILMQRRNARVAALPPGVAAAGATEAILRRPPSRGH